MELKFNVTIKRKKDLWIFFCSILTNRIGLFSFRKIIYFIFTSLMIIFIFGNQLICFLLLHKFKAENNNIENNTNNYGENNKILNYNNYESDIDIEVFRIYKTINFILSILFFAFWIVDVILQATGKINDGNVIRTDNYMSKLFNVLTFN